MKGILMRGRNNNQQGPGGNVNVVDNLLSESSTDALSAKQGKRLDEKKQEKITGGDTGQVLTKLTDEDGEFEWKTPQSGSGGTVGKTFTTNVAIGGIAAGTTIYSTDTVGSVFERMFVMYIAPSITCSITPATALYKKGTSVNITKFSATATKNSKPIQSIKFEMNSTELETITVGVENGGTFNYSGTVPAITTNTTFKTTVSDGTETKSASKSIEFIVPFYWGASNNATVDSIAGFTEDLSKKSTKSYTYATNKQYVTIIYDNSYGALTSIKDQNGFEGISGFNTGTFEENGTTYKYYIAQLATTSASARYTFTF